MTGSQNKQVLAPSPAGLSDRNLDRELDAWINTMHSRLDHLQDAVNSLPIVDAEGNSDCPFATKLYAQKDEELQRVVFSVGLAQGYLARVDSELERRRKDLQVILAKGSELKQPATRQEFQVAQAGQAVYYQHLAQLRGRLVDLQHRMSEVIKRAKGRRMKDQPDSGNDLEMTGGVPSPSSNPNQRPPSFAPPAASGTPWTPTAPSIMGSPPPVLAPPGAQAPRGWRHQPMS